MRLSLFALALALPLTACGGDDSAADAPIEDTGESGLLGRARGMAEAAQQMQEAAERPPADPVNFRQLREMLPETLPAMERTNAEGSTNAAMGFSISEAEATYSGAEAEAGTPEITVKIMDYGALPSMAMMGMAWTLAEVDSETETGYEKTVRMGENKGFRKYNTADRSGEFSLSVAERFLVTVSGRHVEDADLEAALRAVDLGALEGMRDEGRQAAQ